MTKLQSKRDSCLPLNSSYLNSRSFSKKMSSDKTMSKTVWHLPLPPLPSLILRLSYSTPSIPDQGNLNFPLTYFYRSVQEEPVSHHYLSNKNSSSHLTQTSSKLVQLANAIMFDTKVKNAEDEVMLQRKQNLQQLKSIKGYLTGIKTGARSNVYAKVQRSKTQCTGFFWDQYYYKLK